MEKLDARKRYTQMVLKQSFLKLLKEKPVNRITVKEVCALAQLNRATFYAHYSDCFALMESIENELIDAFEKSLRYVNLFDVTAEECINHNIVTVSRNEQLKEALDHALEGSSEERMLELNGRVYQLLANPVRVDNVVSGAVILVLDVTEKQKAEVMRREFSANVSHELKTPLMSISGYAEIIENNIV